ncbi:hypothetical protein CRU99_07025 [Malaciobacter mytili]|uniref:hypothetical protein n=1 Tax=Malaciobacter mytili TaxID=603050 RepID=UPI00100A77EE|nr:hypothetical protein [Malaciobacter mytili]RXI43576.1 hypothetical protein CRU99_07025 [Malaciobacter mytili]
MKNNILNKPAFVENIILWIVMFIGFITLFFFVLEYSNILKTHHQLSLMSDFGAKMTSRNINDIQIIEGLNRLRTQNISTITNDNLICTSHNIQNHQVIFNVSLNYRSSFFNKNILARTVVFNETNNSQIDCTLTLRGNEND